MDDMLLARVDERTELILKKLENLEELVLSHDRDIARLKEARGLWDKVVNGLIAATLGGVVAWYQTK